MCEIEALLSSRLYKSGIHARTAYQSTCSSRVYQNYRTMKSFALVALFALVAYASAAPADKDEPIPILRRSDDGPNPDGSYAFSYETGNGIKAEEQGELRENGEEGIASVRGSYSYQSDDGTPISVSYTADENGFKPEGAHLPVAPAIPVGILRALEWIALHPEEDNLKRK